MGVHADLAGAGGENIPLYTHNIAYIHAFEGGIVFLAQGIARNIKLYAARAVLKMGKAGFAHYALAHNTPGYGNIHFLSVGICILDLLCMMGLIEFCYLIRVAAGLHKGGELVAADAQYLRKLGSRRTLGL